MNNKQRIGLFNVKFTYTEEILRDFENLYNQKKHVTPATRIVCLLLGLAGVVYFGLDLYRSGMSVARVGYFVSCSLLILVAVSGGRDRGDKTVEKYRKHYLDRKAEFTIDEDGIALQISGQKKGAKSKFKEIYGLYETEKCFYFVIQGKAYYILSKSAIPGETADSLRRYMQKKCGKTFIHYARSGEESKISK